MLDVGVSKFFRKVMVQTGNKIITFNVPPGQQYIEFPEPVTVLKTMGDTLLVMTDNETWQVKFVEEEMVNPNA